MMTPKLPSLSGTVLRKIDLIVIHCSATSNGKPIATQQKNAAQVIDDWHRLRNFKRSVAACKAYNPELPSIGYHFVIDLDGTILTGRGLDEVGAHAQGFNANSVGICLIGGREQIAQYTPAQWDALANLTQALSTRLAIPLQPPVRKANRIIQKGICGHRDLSPDLNGDGRITPNEWTKTCPGFDVTEWLRLNMCYSSKHTLSGAL